MGKLVITRGVPASGKSTWAKAWVAGAEVDETRVRINRDDLRFQMFGKWYGVDEQAVTAAQEALMLTYFENNFDVVLDNTNLRARDVKSTLALAHKWGYEVEFVDFPVTYAVAQARDAARDRQVGPDVIDMFFDRFIKSRKYGELPPIPVLEVPPTFKSYEFTPGLPHAIIVDIDGTLAHMQGRSPYDNSLLHTDTADEIIATIASLWLRHTDAYVIVMSGRDAGCRRETEEWLTNALGWHEEFDYLRLYMRPEGDKRNDAVVKNELFEEHIAGKFNVDFCLDDRNRVVDMWRAKGLKVLQVADGNF